MRRWLGSAVLATAIAACHSPKPTGPSWPAPSTTADDGGESLEPKPTSVATSLEKADDDDDDEPAAAAVEEPAAKAEVVPDAEKPATLSPPTQSDDSDEVIISDEIIIEIED